MNEEYSEYEKEHESIMYTFENNYLIKYLVQY